jgi:transposase-like protein
MTAAKTAKRTRRQFTAADKCRAVLMIWTERRSGMDVARELGVTWTVLSGWQEQAMTGMISALEPKRTHVPTASPLSTRLQQLLDRKAGRPAAEKALRPAPVKRLAETEPQKRPES